MHRKKLGRYELSRVLGKGAMGVVYEGRDPNLDRRVALKTIMVDDLTSDAATEYEARFRIEARSAARLLHSNIVTVYDSDRDGDTAFLVMEFVEGEDLKQRLDAGQRYSSGEALRLVGDLLSALDFAHRQGVIHRDVKPANLLVEPGGRLKLTDFGVARITGEATRTQGSMIGTLKYMAPEQVQGQKVDSRADLFSAGVVAYQLLTGTRPFDGDNDFSIIHQILGSDPPPPSTLAPGLPIALDAVLDRALAKDRESRYQTAADFAKALNEAFSGADLSALPPPPSPTPVTPSTPGIRPATVPGAPITQELELEYWRAVRDSTDPSELRGFLQRFPEGIYADLARRRVDRLGGPADPDSTLLQGVSAELPSPATSEGYTLTEPLARLAAEQSRPPSRGTPIAPEPSTVPVAPAEPLPAAEAAQPEPPAPAMPQARSKKAAWAIAAAVAAVALVTVVVMRPRSPEPVTPASASAPAPAAVPAPVVAPAVAAPTTAPAPVAAPAPNVVAAPASAAPPRVAVASRPVRRASSVAAPAVAPATSPATATAAAEPSAASPSPKDEAHSRLVPPAVTCKDKVFLAREYCLQTECAKPVFQNFPACIRLREEARLRDDSKIR